MQTESGVAATVLAAFVLWQVPHFGILQLIYHREYRDSTLPALVSFYNGSQIRWILFVWFNGFVCLAMLLSYTGVLATPWIYWLLAGMQTSILFVFLFWVLRKRNAVEMARLFVCVNGSIGFLLAIILVDRLAYLGGVA